MTTKMVENNDIGSCFKSRTYARETPCGRLYITISFRNEPDKQDKIEFIRIVSFKANECGASFFESLSDLLTFAIRRIRNNYEADAIIKSMEFHRCNKVFPGKKLSCSDAVASVLKEVFNEEKETEEKEQEKT